MCGFLLLLIHLIAIYSAAAAAAAAAAIIAPPPYDATLVDLAHFIALYVQNAEELGCVQF